MRWIFISSLFIQLWISCSDNVDYISYGIDGYPEKLNPGLVQGPYQSQILAQIYEPLITLDRDLKTLKPGLVTGWQVSEDYLQIILTLKPGVLFHDLTNFTAEDVKYSIDITRQNNPHSFLNELIDTLQILNHLSLRISLKKAFPAFLYALTSPDVLLISQHNYKSTGNDFVGTGPYILSRKENKNILELHPFTHYHGTVRALHPVRIIPFDHDTDKRRALSDGRIDLVYMITGFQADRMQWLGKIKYTVQPSTAHVFIGFNNSLTPFDDIKVRKAVLQALDIPKFVYYVNRGNAYPARQPLPPVYDIDNLALQDTFDLMAAKNYLKDAGFDRQLTVRFLFPEMVWERATFIEYLKSRMKQINVNLDVIRVNTWEKFEQVIRSGNCEMFNVAYACDFLNVPEYYLFSLFHSRGAYNFMDYKNSTVDLLLDKLILGTETGDKNVLIKKVVGEIVADTPAIFLLHIKSHYAYNSERIKTIVINPYHIPDFKNTVLYE